jgi:hypothetical protein
MRDRLDADWRMTRGRDKNQDQNPYRRALEEFRPGYHKLTPQEERTRDRLQALADARDAELQEADKALETRLLRESDPNYQMAAKAYAENVNAFPSRDIEEEKYRMAALQSLEQGNYSGMFDHLDKISQKRLAEADQLLDKLSKEESDAKMRRAQAEAEAARQRAASLRPPLETGDLREQWENQQI